MKGKMMSTSTRHSVKVNDLTMYTGPSTHAKAEQMRAIYAEINPDSDVVVVDQGDDVTFSTCSACQAAAQ